MRGDFPGSEAPIALPVPYLVHAVFAGYPARTWLLSDKRQ